MTVKTDFIDTIAWKDELVNFYRWILHSLDNKSRETETSQTFTATASQTDYTLTYGSRFRYVKSVTQNGTALKYGTEFSAPLRGSNYGKVILVSGADEDDTIIITYGYSNSYVTKNGSTAYKDAMVYPDFPRTDLGISKYPRVGIGMMKPRLPGGLGGGTQQVLKTDVRISILILAENTYLLDQFENEIAQKTLQYAKTFYNFRYVYVANSRNIELSEDTTGDVVVRNIDLIVPNRYELISYV